MLAPEIFHFVHIFTFFTSIAAHVEMRPRIKFISMSRNETLAVYHHVIAWCMKCCPLVTMSQPDIEVNFFILMEMLFARISI